MRQAAQDAFRKFTGDLEGADVPFMYLDVKGLATTGNGNLIDPMSTALGLRWLHKATGIVATANEIADAWRTVKARKDLCQRGGMAYEDVTDLILDQAALDLLFVTRLRLNEGMLCQRFPYFAQLPADAQMAIHSMAWAMGAAFHYPNFVRAVNDLDFATAALESHMRDGSYRRDKANLLMLLNADAVTRQGLDPEVLWWPNVAPAVPDAPDTLPEVA